MKEPSRIEFLESRIAPASVSVTYTDVDGDLVKITASKPGKVAPPLDLADLEFVDGSEGQLKTLTLTDTGFDSASITFKVTKRPDGDGLTHVGFIDATGVDLDKVIVKGDLSRIVAGDATVTDDSGVNLLQVRTMGTLGISTQGLGSNLVSRITGKLGALKVAGDFTDAELNADGIGLVFVGGDLTGGTRTYNGQIYSTGAIGDVRIVGDVTGGSGTDSGQIYSFLAMGTVRIGGDVTGGAGHTSGSITSFLAIGALRIGGDVTGGPGENSGSITSVVAMGDVRINGNVTGGAGENSGSITSGLITGITIDSVGAMGDVRIGGNLTGGAGLFSGRLGSTDTMGDVNIGGSVTGGSQMGCGQVSSVKSMGHVRISGDVTGGAGESSGTITSGLITGSTINSVGAMGDVRIGGGLTGGAGIFSGRLGSTDTMGDVNIGGSVTGGGRPGTGQVGSVGSMGHVRIGGNLIGGSIAGDVTLSDSGEIISFGRIASVTIGGSFIAGRDASSGTLLRCGAIVAGDDLGPVKIGGSILGNIFNPALIIAEGQEVKPTTGFDTAIASVTVGGDMRFARILGGFDKDQAPLNADASIGKVTVGSDWVGSSLFAGAEETTDPGFPPRYTLQKVGDTSLVARIASIVIKGDITGSLVGGDNFGILAQQIDKFKIGPHVVSLTVGPGNDQHGFTDDVHVFEVSEPS